MFETILYFAAVLIFGLFLYFIYKTENHIKEDRRKYLDTLTIEDKAKILQYENIGKYRLFRKKNKNVK